MLPGVVYTRVAGVAFHDDVIQLLDFGAGKERGDQARTGQSAGPECLGGLPVVASGWGYLPDPIASVLAPSGTRVPDGGSS